MAITKITPNELDLTGSVTTTANVVSVTALTTTNTLLVPVGTTAQRPTGVAGYLRYNSNTAAFEGHNGTSWESVGGARGGGLSSIFWEYDNTVSANYTISTNKNAFSYGPVTISTGVTVSIPTGSAWYVLNPQ